MSSSPKLGLTPLHIRHSVNENGMQGFATLAPLQAPRFLRDDKALPATLAGDADGLKKMRISDKSFDLDSDSSSDELSGLKIRRNVNRTTISMEGLKQVVETVSPDGHVAKRRVRSRPVSLELLTSASPSPKAKVKGRARPNHHRTSSNTSVSETGSPIKRSRPPAMKPEFDRMASSATLFFGPAIGDPSKPNTADIRPSLNRSSSHTMPPSTPIRPSAADDVFSPASPDSSFTSAFARPEETSISFNLSVTGDSPQRRIPLKFKKPRDSAVILSDDETDDPPHPPLCQVQGAGSRPDSLGLRGPQSRQAQPSTSYSTSSEATLIDDSLVTPCNEPSKESAWPDSSLEFSFVDEFIVKTLEAGTKDDGANKRMPDTPQKRNRTTFLGAPARRPWASAITDRTDRTPLFDDKFAGPDFSNVLDSGSGGSAQRIAQLSKGKPRKSCPGDFRFPSFDEARDRDGMSIKSSGSSVDTSPSRTRCLQPRVRTYGDVGMGRPSTRFNASQFLMRRSSSGAFSIASDISEGSNSGTPTRAKDGGMQYYLMLSPYTNFQFIAEFRVPMLPLRSQYTPSTNTMRLSPEHSPGLKASETLRSVRAPLPISGKHAKENRRPESFIDSNARSGIPTRTNTNRFSLAIPGQRRETDRPRQSPVQKIFGARASLPAHLDSPIDRLSAYTRSPFLRASL